MLGGDMLCVVYYNPRLHHTFEWVFNLATDLQPFLFPEGVQPFDLLNRGLPCRPNDVPRNAR